jgi:MFS family permease
LGQEVFDRIFLGVSGIFMNVPVMAYIQDSIAPEMTGKVFSLLMTAMTLSMPIGLLVAGPVVERLWPLNLPPTYKFAGPDISGQEQVGRLWETGRPVLSSVFTTVEGFPAVDLERPVFQVSCQHSYYSREGRVFNRQNELIINYAVERR